MQLKQFCVIFFCFYNENENEVVETHIPQHWDLKTKKLRHHQDCKSKKPRHRDWRTKAPWHWETEAIKPRHRDPNAFFQSTKSHDVGIPRLKNIYIKIPILKSHDIKFLQNSDLYAPWYTGGIIEIPRITEQENTSEQSDETTKQQRKILPIQNGDILSR